jgi:hypothetical protein
VDQKHHLVPQSLLKRFASNGQLFLTDRERRWPVLTSVERAGREGSFYTLGNEILLPPETCQSVDANPPLMKILERRQDGRYALGPDPFEKMRALWKMHPLRQWIDWSMDGGPPSVKIDCI